MDLPTWKILPWDRVYTTAKLLAMRARQLQQRDEDLEEAVLHLRRSREHGKEEFNARKQLRSGELNIDDLVLLHDTKLRYQFSHKLDFRWLGPYRIADLVRDKGTYFLEKLNGVRLQGTFAGNRLKFFHTCRSTTAISSQGSTAAGSRERIENRSHKAQLHIPEGWNMAVVIPSKKHDEMETFEDSE